MSAFPVVLDACVLVPFPLVDFLLRLVDEGVYRLRDAISISAEATGSDRSNEASRRVHHKTSAVPHDAEPIDAPKIGDVGGHDGYAQLQTGATDPEVVGTDQLTPAT